MERTTIICFSVLITCIYVILIAINGGRDFVFPFLKRIRRRMFPAFGANRTQPKAHVGSTAANSFEALPSASSSKHGNESFFLKPDDVGLLQPRRELQIGSAAASAVSASFWRGNPQLIEKIKETDIRTALIKAPIEPNGKKLLADKFTVPAPSKLFVPSSPGANNCLFDAVIGSTGVCDEETGVLMSSQSLRDYCDELLVEDKMPTIPRGMPAGECYLQTLSKIFKMTIFVFHENSVIPVRHESVSDTAPVIVIRHAGSQMAGHWSPMRLRSQ